MLGGSIGGLRVGWNKYHVVFRLAAQQLRGLLVSDRCFGVLTTVVIVRFCRERAMERLLGVDFASFNRPSISPRCAEQGRCLFCFWLGGTFRLVCALLQSRYMLMGYSRRICFGDGGAFLVFARTATVVGNGVVCHIGLALSVVVPVVSANVTFLL